MRAVLSVGMILCTALLANRAFGGSTYSESFTGGSNVGAWTWGNAADTIHPSGGNPGAWLGNDNLDTFAPQPHTGAGVSSIFTGDYRARRVVSFGVDLITPSTQFPFSRQLTLMLGNDNGTPGNSSDDCFVYVIGPTLVPQPGEGWRAFDFAIPAQRLTLPPGWSTQGSCASPDASWNNVITNVTDVRFFYGDPTNFFIFQVWDVGMDNVRIAEEVGTPFCFGDGTTLTCPCFNASASGEGCMNSTGQGAMLTATGSTSVPADDMCFTTTQLPPGTSALLLQGSSVFGGGVAFGDGVRCASGSLIRLGVKTASADGVTKHGPGLATQGGWAAGLSFTFQTWYRNLAGPCGNGFNVSNAVFVTLN